MARSTPAWSRASRSLNDSGDLGVDVPDGLEDSLAQVAGLVAVAELEGLVDAGRGAGRNGRPAEGAVGQGDFDLDGGVAAGIEDLAGVDFLDQSRHEVPPDGFDEPFYQRRPAIDNLRRRC